MSVEFRVTSEFRELNKIAEERNVTSEWRGILKIKPSVNRVVRLRGRLPTAKDTTDILYDLSDFANITIAKEELIARLSHLAELECTYYPLAENLGARAALTCGLYERIPDFIDTAKELTAITIWGRWRPEDGEDFIDLHKRILHGLKKSLVFSWNKNFLGRPLSSLESREISQATPYQMIESKSPRAKPIYRLRSATTHLSLPSIVATVDTRTPIEKIASFAVLGYYPNGHGLTGVAKEIGVKKETLSEALDRTISSLIYTRGTYSPQRPVRIIVNDLLESPIYRYPSGKNVERTNPRLILLVQNTLPDGLSEREKNIFVLATARKGNTLLFTSDRIAQELGMSKVLVCRIIKRLAINLQ